MKQEVPQIQYHDIHGYYTLTIVTRTTPPRISADFQPSFVGREVYSKQVNFPVKGRRLVQLANDILTWQKKEARWRRWKPTMQDLEVRLQERYPHGGGVEMWFTDWVRRRQNKEEGKRIYEWLQGAAEMGLFDE